MTKGTDNIAWRAFIEDVDEKPSGADEDWCSNDDVEVYTVDSNGQSQLAIRGVCQDEPTYLSRSQWHAIKRYVEELTDWEG